MQEFLGAVIARSETSSAASSDPSRTDAMLLFVQAATSSTAMASSLNSPLRRLAASSSSQRTLYAGETPGALGMTRRRQQDAALIQRLVGDGELNVG